MMATRSGLSSVVPAASYPVAPPSRCSDLNGSSRQKNKLRETSRKAQSGTTWIPYVVAVAGLNGASPMGAVIDSVLAQ